MLGNSSIAELLAQEGEKAKPPLNRAFKRASRAALLWPQEAAELALANQTLTTLKGIGPYLERVIRRWIDSLLLPHDQFMFAELTIGGDEQNLRLVFAAHEVSIRGHHLRRIETVMQRMELSLLTKLPNSQWSLITEGQPVILEIVVTEVESEQKRVEDRGRSVTVSPRQGHPHTATMRMPAAKSVSKFFPTASSWPALVSKIPKVDSLVVPFIGK